METIQFNKAGDPLSIQFTVKNGVAIASYTIKLSDKNSNSALATYEGDNQNSGNKVFQLPLPVADNENRMLILTANILGLDLIRSKSYLVAFEIYQGNQLLKSVETSGNLTATLQQILLFAQLI